MSAAAVVTALSIASSDSSGGAGVQADIKAFARCGVHGATVVVALTAQSTHEVMAIAPCTAELVLAQLDAVLGDLAPAAVKIGLVPSAELVEVVADRLRGTGLPIVLDPVLVATSGRELQQDGGRLALVEHLLPLATVVTPNLPEAQALTGLRTEDRAVLAQALVDLGAGAAVVTGGHGVTPVDHLLAGGRHVAIPVPRHDTGASHGSGCTHSAALAALLARGLDLEAAARRAAALAGDAVAHGLTAVGAGAGPVDVFPLRAFAV